MQKVLANSAATIDEQVKQAKIVFKAMLAAVKKYVPDFLFAAKFGAPAPELRRLCNHIKPNNDAQERGFGIVDFRLQKNRNETTETTDAKLKTIINGSHRFLDQMPDEQADSCWDKARSMVPGRAIAAKERREIVSEQRVASIRKKQQTNARKTQKTKEKKEEFKAVKVARTQGELDKLVGRIHGTVALTISMPLKLAETILRAQITQWTKVHGVKAKTLPLLRNKQNLTFAELYQKLSDFLARGDPLAPKKESAEKKKAKRGRPKSTASMKDRRDKKKCKVDDEMEWSADEA